ncbi:MAG: amino acid ABC transporter permease [Stellaceae bacterium]
MSADAPPIALGFRLRARSFLWSCIATPVNAVLSLGIVLALLYALPSLIAWALVDARWSGPAVACHDARGACWPFIEQRWPLILYGGYPESERWRVDILFALVLVAGALLLSRRVRRKGLIGLLLIVAAPPLAALLLLGGFAGLAYVPAARWGGLMLTVALGGAALAGSFPVGLALALCRRSRLPVIRGLAVGLIEFLRGVPLVPLLFLAMTVLPLLLPPGTDPPPLLRAVVAFILFNGAAMAEVFRGGLQAIPKGQFEAARGLGLSPAKVLALVILPQAIAIVTPGLLNVAIAIVKETTVILIIGLYDFFNEIVAGLADPQWLQGGGAVLDTGYFFAGLVYWAVCFGLSRVSARLELAKERRA